MYRFANFSEFYTFYLSEHANQTCRRLHFIGSCCVLVVVICVLLGASARWLWLLPVIGYGCAWVGHYAFEHNRPATFKHPLYSFIGDWVMFWQTLTGKLRF